MTPTTRPPAPSHAPDFYEVSDYLASLQDCLGLKDWKVILSFETAGDFEVGDETSHALASFETTRGRKVCTVRLGPNWKDADPEEKRCALIHELLHAHSEAIQRSYESVIGPLGSVAYGVLMHHVDLAVEHMVDGIAEAISPLFPLVGGWRDHVWPNHAPRWSAIVTEAEALVAWADGIVADSEYVRAHVDISARLSSLARAVKGPNDGTQENADRDSREKTPT